MSRPTICGMAKELGVSKMSVSVALRGAPGVSDKLRERILAHAKKRRYKPDPVATELMAMLRTGTRTPGAEEIAFINTFRTPRLFWEVPGLADFVSGAQARAGDYGYRVTVYDAWGKGMSEKRLAEILIARGVRGILVGPHWHADPEMRFPWEKFSVVLVGETKYGPNLYRVCNHHAHGCMLALQKLAERGCRRIGLAISRSIEEHHGFNYVAGLEQFCRAHPGRVETVQWLIEDLDPAAVRKWVRDERLDAVIGHEHLVVSACLTIKTHTGRPLVCASLSRPPDYPVPGIDQHLGEIGAASVDLLRGLLVGGVRGEAPRPRILLIEGEWVEGQLAGPPRPGRGHRSASGEKRRTATGNRVANS
jgi:LacI family transcriptional regulator